MSLEEVFLEVLNTSLLVSMIACVIMIIRIVFKRVIPKAGLYALWSIVLIRLVIPISISSPMSLFNAMPQTESIPSVENETFSKVTIVPSMNSSTRPDFAPEIPEIVQSELDNEVVQPSVDEEVVTKPEPQPTTHSISVINILSYVWLAGTGVLLTGLVTWYLITYRRLKKAVRVTDFEILNECKAVVGIKKEIPIFVSDLFTTPVVFGLIKPKIIVPSTLNLDETESLVHMLTHELVHIKRFDHVTKLLSQMLLCVHWFNPFMWLSHRVYEGDMESSCDESVLRMSANDIRGDYATSLLNLASKQQNSAMRSSFVAFGESDLKKRVKGIMGYKNRTVFSIIIAVLLVGLVGCSLLTNPVGDNDKPETDNQVEGNETTDNEVEQEEQEEQPAVDEEIDTVHVESGPGVEEYLSDVKLGLGDTVTVKDESGAAYGELTLDSYEVVQDANGSGRLAVAFWMTEKNISAEPLEVGLYGANPVSWPSNFYNDIELKALAHTDPHPKFWDPEYIENKHVQYGEGQDMLSQSCKTIADGGVLQPGESRSCYYHYSYAGDGEYMLAQPTKGYKEYVNFVVDVKSDVKTPETDNLIPSNSLTVGDSVSVSDGGVDKLEVSLEGYEIISDSTHPTRKGLAVFFKQTNVSNDRFTIISRSNDYYPDHLPIDFHTDAYVSYNGQKLEELNYDTPEDKQVTFPNYKNTPLCTEYTSLDTRETQMCYQFYPYVGDGEYEVSYRTSIDKDEYVNFSFSLMVPSDSQPMSGYLEEYSPEDIIYKESKYPFHRDDVDVRPYLNLGDPVSILEDEKEVGTVSLEGYEVIQDSYGSLREAVVFFFKETNTTNEVIKTGQDANKTILTIPSVFSEYVNLGRLNAHVGTNQFVQFPMYDDIKLCHGGATLNPGESWMCYEYYSYMGEGEYLVSIPKQRSYESISDFESYIVDVKKD